MTRVNVFVYETLRNLTTLSHVVGETPPHETVQVLDHKKVNHGDDYFTLESSEDHKTDGKLVEVTDEELKKLDAWEDRYERREVKLKDGRTAWAYILKKHSMRKSFLEKLIDLAKGGPGSGIKGHRTNRLPYPGVDQHKMKLEPVQDMRERRRTYMPPEGTEHHYSDSKNLRAYKNILRGFKQKGIDFSGHITYDPKTDHVIALSPKAKEIAHSILAELKAKQAG